MRRGKIIYNQFILIIIFTHALVSSVSQVGKCSTAYKWVIIKEIGIRIFILHYIKLGVI